MSREKNHANAMPQWDKFDAYFARMREAELHPFFHAKLAARLNAAPQKTGYFWKFLVPAGAFTGLTLAAWLWLAVGVQETIHPVDEIMLAASDDAAASAVLDPQPPAQFPELAGEEST